MKNAKFVLVGFFLHLSLAGVIAQPATKIPVSGKNRPPIPALDQVMIEFVQKIGCTAGTLAISKNGKVLYERGYGWLNQQRTIPAAPNAYIGIASCEKPITASAVRKLAREGKLDLESPLFATLGIHPAGSIVDRRVNDITFEDVLEHKAGWGGDIAGELRKLAQASGASPPFSIPQLLSQAMSRPLESEPSKVSNYSNFGFDTMRYVVEYESHLTPGIYYREKLLQKNSCHEVGQPNELPPTQQTSRAVWNLKDGGPIFASARFLCAFMDEYWGSGKPRERNDQHWVMYGSLPGSTAIMDWRSDNINIAVVFNGRNETKHDDIKAALDNAVNENKGELTELPSPSNSTDVPSK